MVTQQKVEIHKASAELYGSRALTLHGDCRCLEKEIRRAFDDFLVVFVCQV